MRGNFLCFLLQRVVFTMTKVFSIYFYPYFIAFVFLLVEFNMAASNLNKLLTELALDEKLATSMCQRLGFTPVHLLSLFNQVLINHTIHKSVSTADKMVETDFKRRSSDCQTPCLRPTGGARIIVQLIKPLFYFVKR